MNQRIQGKIEFYAQLLEKLHIISEEEKQQILKQTKKTQPSS